MKLFAVSTLLMVAPLFAEGEHITAVRQLLSERGPKAVPLIQEKLYDADRSVVQEAIRALKKFDTREARTALATFSKEALPIYINESKAHDQFVALNALNTIEALGASAEPALPHLIEKLGSDNYLIRRTAEKAIDSVDTAKGNAAFVQNVVPSVLKDLNDPDEDLRYQTLYHLEQFRQKDQRIADHLLGIAKNDWYPTVREGAIKKLARAQDTRLVPVLRGILERREKNLYQATGDALAIYGQAASTCVPALVKAFQAAGNDYQPLIKALVSLKNPEIEAVLQNFKRERLAQTSSKSAADRASAAADLGLMGPAAADAVPSLRGLLADPTDLTRFETLAALKKINTSEAQAALKEYKENRIPTDDRLTDDPNAKTPRRPDEPCKLATKHLRQSKVHNQAMLRITPRPTRPEQKRALVESGPNKVVHLFWTESVSEIPPCDEQAFNLYFEMDRANSIKQLLYSIGSFENQTQTLRITEGKISMRSQEAKKNRFAGSIYLRFDNATEVKFNVDKERITYVN